MKVALFRTKQIADVSPIVAQHAAHREKIRSTKKVMADLAAQENAERTHIDAHNLAIQRYDDLRARRVAMLAEVMTDGRAATDPEALVPEIARAKTEVERLHERSAVAELVLQKLGARRAELAGDYQRLVRLGIEFGHAVLLERLAASEEQLATAEQAYYAALETTYAIAGAANNLARLPTTVQLPMVRRFDPDLAMLQRPTDSKPADLAELVRRIMAGSDKLINEVLAD